MSNLIKSGRVVSLEDLKQLELIRQFEPTIQNISHSDGVFEGNGEPDVETQSLKDRILRDTEHTAEQILLQARDEAADIRASAKGESEEWWQTRRAEDQVVVEQARQIGYEDGYRAGTMQAEQDVRLEWAGRLEEAHSVVEQAYIAKENIIWEAESFLVELSCSIAEKLVAGRLAEEPELTVKLFAKALARRKEQGVITLCVSPSQFRFVQAARDELALSLDSQADLQVVPDPAVGEGGCIIRSSFGSIDARIDTQLAAIRVELLRVTAHAAEEGDANAAS